jgi:DNA-binding CsgD family transcriptional regulator/tetratricopeptide (TPR) repeat protein
VALLNDLVGRDRELRLLMDAVGAAEGGHGRLLLISGAAGIGKSALAARVTATARGRGFSVLSGQAAPLQAGLAYAPMVQALRGYLNTLSEQGFARLLHGLHDLATLIADPRLPTVPPHADPELARTRMFEAVVRLVERIAASTPVLLVVDDLHWADRGTIGLLHHLGRAVRDKRVLIVTGFRSAERDSALADLVMLVRREWPGDELALPPLADRAVAELVRHTLGAEPSADVLGDITARAKGVPLFVTALARSGSVTGRSDVPLIVRDVVTEQLRRLAGPALRLVEAIAVAGGAATTRVLSLVCTVEVAASLRELIGQGLVNEVPDGLVVTHRLAHPLYAEVAYGQLTLSERAALHAAVAEAIDGDDILAVAPHYLGAGGLVTSARAIDVLAAAGERALAMLAADEAADYFEAALYRVRAAARRDLLPALLISLGRALQGCGRLDDAASAWREAAELAEQDGDTKLVRGLWHTRALLAAERGNVTAAVDHVRTWESQDDPRYALVQWVVALREGDERKLRRIGADMRSLAGPHPGAMSVAYFGDSQLHAMDGEYAKALSAMRLALDAAEGCGDQTFVFTFGPCLLLPGLYLLAGDIGSAMAFTDNALAKQMRTDMPGAACYFHLVTANTRFVAGELAGALAEAELCLAIARQVGEDRLVSRGLACRAFLLAEQGRLTRATTDLAEAVRRYPAQPDFDLDLALDIARATIAFYQGDPRAAPPLAEPAPFGDIVLRHLRVAAAGLAAPDPAAAAKAAGLLRESGRTAPFVDALADRHEGLLLARRNRPADARALLDAAATRLDGMGAPLLAAQACLESAELSPDPDAAAVTRCLNVFVTAGAGPWIQRARRMARGSRLPVPAPTGVLSGRETEIAVLVGEGLTNAQIARRLYLSERTVETHLHHSYRKLGFSSRITLAQWATRQAT